VAPPTRVELVAFGLGTRDSAPIEGKTRQVAVSVESEQTAISRPLQSALLNTATLARAADRALAAYLEVLAAGYAEVLSAA
jgi:hypothetical protein